MESGRGGGVAIELSPQSAAVKVTCEHEDEFGSAAEDDSHRHG